MVVLSQQGGVCCLRQAPPNGVKQRPYNVLVTYSTLGLEVGPS